MYLVKDRCSSYQASMVYCLSQNVQIVYSHLDVGSNVCKRDSPWIFV